MDYGGDYYGDIPIGGHQSLLSPMAAGLDVLTGVEVAEIVLGDDGVTVLSAGGDVEEGSHVVVTVPLGVLKGGAPRFSPNLPADRMEAIARLGFGPFEKVAVRFEEPFWRAAGVSHMLLFPDDPDEAVVRAIGQDAFGAGTTLVFLILASAAKHVLDATAEEAAKWALGMFAESLGAPCPTPKAIATSKWGNDPYSRGAYTHIPPGASPADVDALGEPIGGRVLFAGEHTQSARLGYADGAMSSGIREAKRLLHQREVRLGRILDGAPS